MPITFSYHRFLVAAAVTMLVTVAVYQPDIMTTDGSMVKLSPATMMRKHPSDEIDFSNDDEYQEEFQTNELVLHDDDDGDNGEEIPHHHHQNSNDNDDEDNDSTNSTTSLLFHRKYQTHYSPDDPTVPLPHNILLVKVPKTGGTTLAVMLQRYARLNNQEFAVPALKPLVNTCERDRKARDGEWASLLKHNNNRLEVFGSHSCMNTIMLYPTSQWKGSRMPLIMTMVRDPWNTIVSEYRYVKKCCHTRPQSWCLPTCPHVNNFETFINHYCGHERCSTQVHYVAGDWQGKGPDKVLDRYDFIFLLERFDEGLALLATLYNFPFSVLPYVVANPNTLIPFPQVSDEFKAKVLKTLVVDRSLYKQATLRFDATLASLNAEEYAKFNTTLTKLRAKNKEIAASCRDRRGDNCLQPMPTVQHASGCFTDCVDAVVEGRELPVVTKCSKCDQFFVSCQKCKCVGDGTAKCEEILNGECHAPHARCMEHT